MSETAAFEAEKIAIERMVALGYRIYTVQEHLEGADVVWEHPDQPGEWKQQHVGTASGRKWFAHFLVQQLREQQGA
ncbi:hypothetical protein [Paenibacillus xylanexedens]|uniref:hypothetical protein n=1 Tax=Paenibacillus xylanexedens TaxID=528191 RepID=UPI0011A94F2A|nr:hypothetical protein [Paenibacillus xylanexedens]